MGAARYIGRVGGLAVALGVGTAIATGHGVALADTTDANTSSASDSEQSSTGESTGTATTTDTTTTSSETTTDTESEAEPDAEPGDTESTSTTTSTTVGDGVTVRAQTNTGSSTSEPTDEAAEDAEASEEPAPTQTAEPQPTATPDSDLEQEPADSTKSDGDSTAVTTTGGDSSEAQAQAPTSRQAEPDTTLSARTVQSSDPAATVQEPARVAVFADARSLATSGTESFAPLMAAQSTAQAPAAPRDLFTAVANVVSSAINWVLNPLAGNTPASPAQPPLIWGLLAFARREFDRFFTALAGGSATTTAPTALTTLSEPMARLALAAQPIPTPAPPFNRQVSPSTQFVSWVTGPYVYPSEADPTEANPLLANTLSRYSVYGTDLGIMWDNGIPDDPSTPDINEHQVLIAVGDTFGGPFMQGDWRSNTIFRSSDIDLANGMEIPDGQWFNGNMFGGAPLGPTQYRARQVIFPDGLPAGITLIPTAGISLPDPDSEYGAIQYVSFMSVTQWGSPGSWTTNYSAIAYSDDNGETFKVAPQTVRYNNSWSGHNKFQQSAFVRGEDGYVYMYGTPNGRQGAAYLARVPEKDILNLSQYEYWNKGSSGGWFGWGATKAGWYKNNPGAATAVFGVDKGACGVANPGNNVSEMSVQYNKSLNKYVVLYGDQFNNIVMRTSDTPQGTWSSAKVLMPQQNGGIYAPMMHPWSPSTLGTGDELYWNLSHWGNYNVMLMRTDLTKV